MNRSKQRSTQKIFGEDLGLCCFIHINVISSTAGFFSCCIRFCLNCSFTDLAVHGREKKHISAIFHLCSRINLYLPSHNTCYLWELMGLKLGVMASSCSKTVIDFNVKLCKE